MIIKITAEEARELLATSAPHMTAQEKLDLVCRLLEGVTLTTEDVVSLLSET